MQVQTGTTTKTKAKKEFNLGDTVEWDSHANGNTKTKTGTIVAVLKPDTSYRHLRGLPKKFYEKVLLVKGYTRDEARKRIESPTYTKFFSVLLADYYKLKFNPAEGMGRDTYHYLIEVEPGPGRGSYTRLYHPKTHLLRKA